MSTLQNININSGKILSEAELKSLKGGVYPLCFYDCFCYVSPNPPFVSPFSIAAFTAQEVLNEINQRCSGGGHCDEDWCYYG